MRAEHGNDIFVDVDDVGRFRFGRRTMRDVFLIRSEYNRLSSGNYSDDGLPMDIGAWAVATLFTLLVAAPDSFDLEKVDPLVDENWESKIAKVYDALRAKELSFRPNRAPKEQAPGAGDGQGPPTDVPTPVQPSAQ